MKHDDEDTNANHKLGKIFFSSHFLPFFLAPLNEERKITLLDFFPFFARYCCFLWVVVWGSKTIFMCFLLLSQKWNKCNFAKHFFLLLFSFNLWIIYYYWIISFISRKFSLFFFLDIFKWLPQLKLTLQFRLYN